ncbi:DUF6777 domain-containing protein [Streptomyces sp. NPDC046887]|uniref:DUF6777 domain-containing protein n=1 Tax=Streptomyces sp. NPDC046887 TaxID=3155472 RepID=UPI0033EE3D5D
MPTPTCRRRVAPQVPAAYTLAVALLVAGCGGGEGGGDAGPQMSAGAQKVRLLPAGDPGPDPFTASTARPAPGLPASAASPAAGARGQSARSVPGSTPGLYGGTRSVPSCDVERQASLLTEDATKARAFAQAAGVTPAGLAPWVRGLTPVLLRADARVTGHGYRDGAADPYQAVLQTGTAVMVDRYGTPRVRCAGGNPLRTAVDARGAAEHEGEAWPGFDPGRTLMITPTRRPVESLVIVNVLSSTWVERPMGTSGAQDAAPTSPPPYAPGERDLAEAAVPEAEPSQDPGSGPATPPGRQPEGTGPAPRPDQPEGERTVPGVPDGGTAVPDGPGTGEPERPGRPDTAEPEGAAPETVEPEDCPTDPGEGIAVPPGCPTPPPPPEPPVMAEPEDLYGPDAGPYAGGAGGADGAGEGGDGGDGGPQGSGPASGPDGAGPEEEPVFDME